MRLYPVSGGSINSKNASSCKSSTCCRAALPTRHAASTVCLQVNKDLNSTSTPHGCSRIDDWGGQGAVLLRRYKVYL